ncbi:MAG: chorismate mutase, partial [Leptonema sp. (in: bacteria)]
MNSLSKYREEIDQIDQQIVELILKRSELASEIGKIKKQNNLPIYKPEREVKIYENIKKLYQEFYKDKKIENKNVDFNSSAVLSSGEVAILERIRA